MNNSVPDYICSENYPSKNGTFLGLLPVSSQRHDFIFLTKKVRCLLFLTLVSPAEPGQHWASELDLFRGHVLVTEFVTILQLPNCPFLAMPKPGRTQTDVHISGSVHGWLLPVNPSQPADLEPL